MKGETHHDAMKLGFIASAALGICLIGCGEAGSKLVSGSVSSRRSSPVVRNTSGVALSPSHLFGDYDSDDQSGAKGSDADGDDSLPPIDRDGDSDNRSGSYFDRDDDGVLGFGHAADTSKRLEVARLVKSYYAAASAENGGGACPMLMSSIAKSIPEDLGRPPGPAYARGATCAAVMTKVFKESHRQLDVYASRLEIAAMRIDGDRGLVVLAFKGLPAREIDVSRESGRWRMELLLDHELP